MRKQLRARVSVPLRDHLGNLLYSITYIDGSARCAAGLAVPIRDYRYGRNEVVGYRLTVPVRASNSDSSMVEITVREIHLNVLRSSTARLPEWDTKGRDSKQARIEARDPDLPPEDDVELAQQRIQFWPDARNPLSVPLWNPKHGSWAGHAART